MKFRLFLATATLLCAGSVFSHAALQQEQQTTPNAAISKADAGALIMEARKNRGRGGESGGKGRGRGGDKVKSTDDNGSGSGRKKPRVPGGSGCDDAGDVAEHASCS